MIENLKIEKAESDKDYKVVAALAETVWHFAYDGLVKTGGVKPGQVEYMIDKFQSEDALKRDTKNNGYIYYLARLGDKLAGYCGVRPEDKRLFVSKVYVSPEYFRNGIAKRFMHMLAEEFSGKDDFYLTVNKQNEGAVSAYTALGFKKIDEAVSDIGNGYVMDDYIMSVEPSALK